MPSTPSLHAVRKVPHGEVTYRFYESRALGRTRPYLVYTPPDYRVGLGDGVRGQAYAGSIQAYSGLIIALLAPFLGAIADSGGRRKPWVALYTLILVAAMFPLWFAMPHQTGWNLFLIGALWATVPRPFEASYYISGPPAMLHGLSHELRGRGIVESDIHIDAWE